MDVTATEHYSTWILPPMDETRYRTLLQIDSIADGRNCYKTLQPSDSTVDECYRCKTSMLQISKILASRRLLQLDANTERMHFFAHFQCLLTLQ